MQKSYKVVVGIFDGSEGEYPDQGYSGRHGCQRGYCGYELQNQQAQEVKVGEPLKLLEQIQRQERQNRILGRFDVIVLQFISL